MNYSPPGSSVHGIHQARILEWVAIPFSRGSSWPRDWTWVSCITGRFFAIWATREGESNTLSVNKSRASMDRGVWQATVHEVAKSCAQLKQLSTARNQQWKSSWHHCSVFYKRSHGVSVYFPFKTDSAGKLTGLCSCVIYYLCWLSWNPRRGCSSLWVHHSFCTVQAHPLPRLPPKVELAGADVVPLLIIL